MNSTSISLVKAIINNTHDIAALKKISKVKTCQFNEVVKKLLQDGYIKKEGKTIALQESAKTILLKKISQKWNLVNLLRDSNELVFSYLIDPLTINEIVTNTGLSTSTVYRAISDLEAIGIIRKEIRRNENHTGKTPERMHIDASKTELVDFARILRTERERFYESDAEVLYADKEKIVRKVTKGKITEGELTAFSVFTNNGIMYESPYDYYVKQDEPLDIHDIIIHSVLASFKANDKMGLIMSAVFYIHNKNRVDVKRLRETASSFGISSTWLDVEGYIRRQKLKNESLFLPWNEFVSKAELYEIKPEQYVIPTPAPSLFEDIGSSLAEPLQIFLMGGENMRLKKLKAVTKDCDLIVEKPSDFEILCKVLTEKLAYEKIIETEYSQEDLRLYPDEILVHPNGSRIDLFTKRVLKDLSLSDVMIQTADYLKFGKLRVGVLRNEYVFLLKAVASREGDIQDMALLSQVPLNQSGRFEHDKFDWDEVWREIIHQEKMNPIREIAIPIFEQMSVLAEQTGIVAPILEKLGRHVVERLILRTIRGGRQRLKEIVSLLIGGDISEQMIRNRIDALVREKAVKKITMEKKVFVAPVQIPRFPYRDWQATPENVEAYLSWRFPMRLQSTPNTIKGFADGIAELGYDSLGYLDDMVVDSLEWLLAYERLYLPEEPRNSVGAARICIGFSDQKLAKDDKSDFHISNFENFVRTENDTNCMEGNNNSNTEGVVRNRDFRV